MRREEADQDNAHYQLPTSVPSDPSSSLITAPHTRSDLQAGSFMSNLPPLPDHRYTFSTRQCVKQFQLLKDERNRFETHANVDLYNATIVAVCQSCCSVVCHNDLNIHVLVPEQCSAPLQRIVEALFITHAQTQLNNIGHLDDRTTRDDSINVHDVTEAAQIVARTDWCRSLNRPSS